MPIDMSAQILVNQGIVIAPTARFHWSRAGISILFFIGFQAFDKLYLNIHLSIYRGVEVEMIQMFLRTTNTISHIGFEVSRK
jgi:hypothetical protein